MAGRAAVGMFCCAVRAALAGHAARDRRLGEHRGSGGGAEHVAHARPRAQPQCLSRRVCARKSDAAAALAAAAATIIAAAAVSHAEVHAEVPGTAADAAAQDGPRVAKLPFQGAPAAAVAPAAVTATLQGLSPCPSAEH
eukprot:359340-Chlamydomonas_euryale.AAC.1